MHRELIQSRQSVESPPLEAQFVFNDSTSLRIAIDGPDCTSLATNHVSLSAETPPGWTEFFLRGGDGGT